MRLILEILRYLAMAKTESQSDFELTKDTPYLTLTGELWGVSYDYLGNVLQRYKRAALYLLTHMKFVMSRWKYILIPDRDFYWMHINKSEMGPIAILSMLRFK